MRQGCGVLMLVGLVVGALCIVYAVAPTATVLGGWTAAAGWLWWGVSRKIDNPSPPPPDPPSESTKPQVKTIVKDETHPTRYRVEWADEGTK